MNEPQKRLSRTKTLATAAFALVFFTLLTTSKVHADPIAITGGSYTLTNPFRNEPRFIGFASDLRGTNFRTFSAEGDGPAQRLGSNCPYPCTVGSTFAISGTRRIGKESPTSVLEIDGQSLTGFFVGPGNFPQFDTGSVTIPLNAGAELTLSTFFTMSGTINFLGYDLQQLAFTGFSFSADIFGSGVVDISLFFSQTTRQYEVSRVRYNFQPEPVPEPVTLLLLGTGLAGIAAKSYKRRRARKQV